MTPSVKKTVNSVLGNFDIFMLPMYGEDRKNAFDRLQDILDVKSRWLLSKATMPKNLLSQTRRETRDLEE